MKNIEHLKLSHNFRRKAMASILIASVIVFLSQTTIAQNSWSIEFRPNANFAIQKSGEANLNMGYGAEGIFAYRFMSHLLMQDGVGTISDQIKK